MDSSADRPWGGRRAGRERRDPSSREPSSEAWPGDCEGGGESEWRGDGKREWRRVSGGGGGKREWDNIYG